MRVLVKNCETLRFLMNDEHWTLNPAEALEFPSSLAAMDFCVHHHIQKAEVILKAREDRYDIHLPLSPECRETC